MRFKESALCACTFLACLVFSARGEALCTKVAKANIRSGPGTGHELIWEVYRYMPFQKVGESESGEWFAVRDVDGDVSWIHKHLVSSSNRCAVVKKATVNVRSGPGTRYRKTRWSPARQYDSFRVLKRQGSWIKVKDRWGDIGWIHRKFLWIP